MEKAKKAAEEAYHQCCLAQDKSGHCRHGRSNVPFSQSAPPSTPSNRQETVVQPERKLMNASQKVTCMSGKRLKVQNFKCLKSDFDIGMQVSLWRE